MQKEITNKAIFGYLQKIDSKLDEQQKILNKHTDLLNEHGNILNEHTVVLNKHTNLLNKQGAILNEHSITLNKHTDLLNEHSVTLMKQGNILNKHGILLTEQQESTQGIIEYIQEQIPTKEEMTVALRKQKHELMDFMEERLGEKLEELKNKLIEKLVDKKTFGRLLHVLEKKEVINRKEAKTILPIGSFA